MPIAKHKFCPVKACGSSDIREHSTTWHCRACGADFGQPAQKTRTKTAGSGVIAPRPYRAQIAFDAMQLTNPDTFRPVPAPDFGHHGIRKAPTKRAISRTTPLL